MHPFARGVAFVDRSGTVLAADAGFVSQLGLDERDVSAALRARAEAEPELRALLAGDGPGVTRTVGPSGDVEVERVPSGADALGALVLVRPPRCEEHLEHAMRSQGLTRLVAGVAHDIKNPLNAMALQIALLTDKLAGSGDALASSASHLAALRDQIGRVNEVVRRFLDVTDPSAPLGYTDVSALVADTASLFGHDARRRRVELAVDAAPSVRTRCDPGRVSRLVVGLFYRALVETPERGRLAIHVAGEGPDVRVSIEHTIAEPDPELRYYTDVAAAAAAALGGDFARSGDSGIERVSLRLPRNERE